MKDLAKLCVRLKLNSAIVGGLERKEVIQAILESGKIGIIVAPEPVEYESISVLRGMGVGKLKKAMSEAGVFFDARDVVEKEDMVQIFANSGRIVLMQMEEANDEGRSNNDYGHNLCNFKNEGKVINDRSDAKRARREEEPDNVSMLEKKPAHVTKKESIGTNEEDIGFSSASIPHSFRRRTSAMYNHYVDSSADSLHSEGFSRTSVANLRELATKLRIDISDCIEKKEMTDRILAVVSRGR